LYDKEIIIDVAYSAHPIITDFISQMRSSEDIFSFRKLKVKPLPTGWQYLERGQEKVDPRLESASALLYYFYSIGPGGLGVSTYDTPMPDQDIVVLKRFRNVFQLAYQRIWTLRSQKHKPGKPGSNLHWNGCALRTMAMQRSEEMVDASNVLFTDCRHWALKRYAPGLPPWTPQMNPWRFGPLNWSHKMILKFLE
jgi:hypothetical protein